MLKQAYNPAELKELRAIQKWFPEARLKEDYNREILDIGAEIPLAGDIYILLKGDQTGSCYEIVTPDCRCIDGLKDLQSVYDTCMKLSSSTK